MIWALIIALLGSIPFTTSEQPIVISVAKYEAQPTLDLLASNGFDPDYFEHGVSVNAALKAYDLGEFVTDRDVFYVTSAGSFNPDNEGRDLPYLVTVNNSIFMPTAYRMGLGNALPNLFPNIELTIENDLNDLPVRSVLTSPTISYSDAINISSLPEASRLIENMEVYYLKAALSRARSVRIIVAITNNIGPNAGKEYQQNHVKAAQMTADYVLKTLQNMPKQQHNNNIPTIIAGSVGGVVVVAACFFGVKRLRNKSADNQAGKEALLN